MPDGHVTCRRHCWECRRRCVVCDFAEPACKRCSRAGIACPGYGERKPLRYRWLTPGIVTSRGQKANKGILQTNVDDKQPFSDARSSSKFHGAMMFPRYQLTTDLCALGDAVKYFNSCIYHELLPLHELGPNPFVYPIVPSHLQRAATLPNHLRFSLVCTALSHRINRTRHDPHHRHLLQTFYEYRGIVIRSLRDDARLKQSHMSDWFIAGVVSLLLIDLQHGVSTVWQSHIRAVQALITLRGGIEPLARSGKLDSLLLCFIGISVLGNTTCPASDIVLTDQHRKELEFMVDKFGSTTFAFQMCPASLFAEITRINSLRMRARKSHNPSTLQQDMVFEAHSILRRIGDFSPSEWVKSKPSGTSPWQTLGFICKSATALYCILSLQSALLLPCTQHLARLLDEHAQALYALLQEAISVSSIKRLVLWPLIVLGVEAAERDGWHMQIFVRRQLVEMSSYLGSHAPLAAKALLEKFWTSGETKWDLCFDRAYAFAAQFAVDISRISVM
ncbi:hypothetical protein QQS21_002197 [Conoideocrella luteorostrata]|uniref:Zn(2)-C6 fungal-type domain-containing protein n=1 Tax=Conoideocrella luteorostrata TaxID=1105319 RepID=A0AAJ0CVK9_9HYPO|nr:hypothetical protein QQS21_002197 [Conoideocrella luteorostrata]